MNENNTNSTLTSPNFKTLVKMSFQGLTNFPYIEEDFDALTNYGLLSKVVEYLNEVISNNNEQNRVVTELYNAFIEIKDYVDNYFENLDVQDEINNKLDELVADGTLTQLIGNYVDPRLDEFESQVNNSLSSLNTKVDALSSASPLVASDVSEMTDTTKIYVNTTDGNWYYYDGDSWEIGGEYQSTGIANNYITQPMLNYDLKNIVNTKNPELTFESGKYRNSLGNISNVSDGYVSDPFDLKYGETLYFKCNASTSVCVICRVNDDNTRFIDGNKSVLVMATSTSSTLYKYTAVADMKVSISYLGEYDYYFISHVDNKIIENKLLDLYTGIEKKTIIKTDGKYINANTMNIGTSTSYFYTNPIHLNKNETIIVFGQAIPNVAVLSSCDSTGNNRHLIVAGDGEGSANQKIFEFTALSDMYVIVSAYLVNFIGVYSYESQNEVKNNNLIDCFLHVGCIGDSLASGESAYKDSGVTHYVDRYDYSWGQFLARKTGNIYYNFSKGGMSTRSWFTDSMGSALAFDGNHDCEGYIIGLGVNDVNKLGIDYLGTISDVDFSDYTNNADTFYGNYAKIIQMIFANQPKAKIFVLHIPLTGDTAAAFNTAISTLVSRFDNVYMLNLDNQFNSGFIDLNKRSGHYNALGYKTIANVLYDAISGYMETNYTEFSQIEFIGTEYEW